MAKTGSIEEMTMNMENPHKNLIGVIDLILQKTEVETDKKSFRIDLSDVRTNSIEEKRELIIFLNNLKKKGALYDFERFTVGERPGSPISSLFYYKFTVKPNKDKLLEERKRLINFDQPQLKRRSPAHSSENKGPIKKLELVKPKAGNKFKVVINEGYLSPIHGDRAKSSWDLLFRIAEGQLVEAENHKTLIDYFNSNKACRLYTRTGYKMTKILKAESGYIMPAVEIKAITEKMFSQRANKSSKQA